VIIPLSPTSVTSDNMMTVTVTGHKMYKKDVEYSERDDIIQCVIHMLTLRYIHGHLG